METTKAGIFIGIDHYGDRNLRGCVADAKALAKCLKYNARGEKNFDIDLLTSSDVAAAPNITTDVILAKASTLFEKHIDVAMFYFAGHAEIDKGEGYLLTEGQGPNCRVRMSDLLKIVNESKASQRIVILDCCYSGQMGLMGEYSNLKMGVSVLTSTRHNELAVERNGRGIFSEFLCEAISGGAADVLGKVTLTGLLQYLDNAFTPMKQRPTFCCNSHRVTYLKSCTPTIPVKDLRRIVRIFSAPDDSLQLGPEYEKTEPTFNPQKGKIFELLQRFRAADLVRPVGEKHMYYAALNCKPVVLTPKGRIYWKIVNMGGF
jgi:hypothetical protein